MKKLWEVFKHPSQKWMHKTLDFVKELIVFTALYTLIIKVGIKLHWNINGIYVFSVYGSWVISIMLALSMIMLVGILIRIKFYMKNTTDVGDLGRIVTEYQFRNRKLVKVASIHLDRKSGVKKIKSMTNTESVKFMLAEFIEIMDTLKTNDKYKDCELYSGSSSKIKERLFSKIGIKTTKYKSTSAALIQSIAEAMKSKNKIKAFTKSFFKTYKGIQEFYITKEELENLDLSYLRKRIK